MSKRAIDLTPREHVERWIVASVNGDQQKPIEGVATAWEAWDRAKLRDGLGVLLPFGAVRVRPAKDSGGEPCTGRGKPAESKTTARREKRSAPSRSAPEPSSSNGRAR